MTVKQKPKSAGEHRVFRILCKLCEDAHKMFPEVADSCTEENPCVFCAAIIQAKTPPVNYPRE